MPRSVLLLINSLEGGGAEKVMVSLVDHLAQRAGDWDVCLATLDDLPDAYRPSRPVERVRLDCGGSFRRSIAEVRRLVARRKPDVVISFLTRANCAAVLACRGSGTRCVISERVHTTSHLGKGLKAALFKRVVRHFYPKADAVVAVSEGVATELTRRYGVPAAKTATIPNPVFVDALHLRGGEPAQVDLPEDFIVSVGRLAPNKGFDTLLHAFAAHRNKQRRLVLLGEGPERARLVELAVALGLEGRVQMPGYIANPQAVVARARAYVSASRSEGFPNALVEAMALGRMVIATDCPSGPSEILAEAPYGRVRTLEPSKWGVLVPVDDRTALTGAMDLIDDRAVRERYERRSFERVQTYRPEQVFRRYEDVLFPTRCAAPVLQET